MKARGLHRPTLAARRCWCTTIDMTRVPARAARNNESEQERTSLTAGLQVDISCTGKQQYLPFIGSAATPSATNNVLQVLNTGKQSSCRSFRLVNNTLRTPYLPSRLCMRAGDRQPCGVETALTHSSN